MDRSFYVSEVRRQLADTTTYKKIQNDPTHTIRQKIARIVDKHLQLKTIDNKTKTYLINLHPVTPVLYILPKIHKNLRNPPGRPIVASTDSILNPLSMFLEKLLTPYTKVTKSFILDTGDFLGKIRNMKRIPSDSILCTLDVNSLYTSITHDMGIEAVSQTLSEARLDKGTQDLCIDLLSLVLRENFFIFEDDFFLQTCGTAMGSNVAPAYANLYMDRFERDFVYTNPGFQQHALAWYRYIDDVFCVWRGNLTSLLEFYDTINTVRPELSFTLVHHSNEVTFLDTKIIKDSIGNLSTDIFTKPTDCNSLLLYNSCHPRSTKNSLPRSQFKRVTRIVSNPSTLESRLHEMSDKFKARQYPLDLLNTESSRALHDSDNLNSGTQKQKNPRLPFVHNYHPTINKIHNLIRGHWPLLNKAYPNIPIFKDPPLMCTRRPKNIRDKVVRADLGSQKTAQNRTLTGHSRTDLIICTSSLTFRHNRDGQALLPFGHRLAWACIYYAGPAILWQTDAFRFYCARASGQNRHCACAGVPTLVPDASSPGTINRSLLGSFRQALPHAVTRIWYVDLSALYHGNYSTCTSKPYEFPYIIGCTFPRYPTCTQAGPLKHRGPEGEFPLLQDPWNHTHRTLRYRFPISQNYRNSVSEFRYSKYRPIPDTCSIGMLNTSYNSYSLKKGQESKNSAGCRDLHLRPFSRSPPHRKPCNSGGSGLSQNVGRAPAASETPAAAPETPRISTEDPPQHRTPEAAPPGTPSSQPAACSITPLLPPPAAILGPRFTTATTLVSNKIHGL
ncbi:unnamed protein product [Ranitomeya imitator]|uniref:Reverse transcriptase domain-containing protein n=1 Tax=Ranitomeya imitator TaxID=111125 RepID=A0ABN9LYK2_9NEOB|nr:unnamed protein product [Ranitomeya imitator]